MKKHVLTYGLICGAIVSLTMAIGMITANNSGTDKLGSNTMMIIGYLSMLIAFSLIFVAVKTYRDKQANGVISFGKALGMGLLIVLIASTMYVVTWAIVHNTVMPDFMDKYAAATLEKARATATPEEFSSMSKEMEEYKAMYKSPAGFALMTYAEIVPVGLIVSLITALVLKRSPKPSLA
jgi:hypothetical protein